MHGAATVEVKEQNIHRQSLVLSKLCVWGKELQNALNAIVMWGKQECAQDVCKPSVCLV